MPSWAKEWDRALGLQRRPAVHTGLINKSWVLPYDPAIPLLDIYPEKMKTLIWKDTCTPMFIAALFTIAKTWKQPKCPSTDEWMVVCVYIYMCVCVCVCVCVYIYIYIHNAILFSHKKEWNIAICRNMDACRVYHTEWSKSDRERQILYDITYVISRI